jgi:predicted transcriptional regulator
VGESFPQPGDVVVQWQMRSPAVYVLSRRDERTQRTYETYEEALARAIGCARREHLDAWYTNDGQVFERLSQHRPTAGRPGQL